MFVNFIDNNEHYWLKSVWSPNSKVNNKEWDTVWLFGWLVGWLVVWCVETWDRLLGSLVLFTFLVYISKSKRSYDLTDNFSFSSITAQIQRINKIASTSLWAVLFFVQSKTKCLFTLYHNLTSYGNQSYLFGLESFDICLVCTEQMLTTDNFLLLQILC